MMLLAALLLLPMLSGAQAGPLDVQRLELSNGMVVWLNEDHSQPLVYGAVVVRAGAKDCPDTGLAHYLEHLLFKGTEEMGTVDYAAEKVWLDSIAICYDAIAATKDEAERLALQKEINRLSIKAADYAIPNEFDRLTAAIGGTGLNAGTSYDYTYYYNTFSPQYMAQWCELNSHRLLNPVFRIFQGELETVYEEKNRSADNTMQAPLFEMIKIFSDGNPYSYQIIGSTENLKNPRLGEMMDFFRRYYVGCNMGLILAGDIDAANLKPLLESTFGRIRRGEVPEKTPVTAPVLKGHRDVKIKADIPLVKIAVYAFNGPKEAEADAPALDLATGLLSNSFSSGLLDSLMTGHKLLMGGAARLPLFNEMGIVGFAVIPSLPFGSLPKAEKRCWEQIDKIRRGAFSDADVEALKLEASRSAQSALETINGRASVMVDVMSQGRSWEQYLQQVQAIQGITREDIIRVANKYFNDNYIRFEKVKGTYPKDKVSKPDFAPILPKNAGAESAYARRLMEMPVDEREARLVDFGADVQRLALTEHVTLYYKANPVDELFNLSLRVDEGSFEDSRIPHTASLLNTIGTDSLSVHALGRSWQQLGTTFSAGSGSHFFSLNLSGFDSRLTPSLRLMRHFIDHAKADKAAFKELKQSVDLEKKTFFTGGTSNLMDAAKLRVFYGEESPYLTQLSSSELGKVGMNGLMAKFSELMDSDCSIIYSGSLPLEEVAAAIRSTLDLGRARNKPQRHFLHQQRYEEPTVFFYDLADSRQAQIMSYQTPEAPASDSEKALLKVLGEYVGGGMFSLMFQEVREFRAMAYSAHGAVDMPVPAEDPGEPALLYTSLGTQADKALSAVTLVDSLLRTLPLREEGIAAATRSLVSRANNSYPSFRQIASSVHNWEVTGYKEDPNRCILENLGGVDGAALGAYYNSVVAPSIRCWIIVGDRKKLPMDEIARFGRIVELKKNDIYK